MAPPPSVTVQAVVQAVVIPHHSRAASAQQTRFSSSPERVKLAYSSWCVSMCESTSSASFLVTLTLSVHDHFAGSTEGISLCVPDVDESMAR